MKLHPTILSHQSVVDVSSADPFVSYAAVVFIVIGAVAFVVGFFGCCGAFKEQPSCLFTVSYLSLPFSTFSLDFFYFLLFASCAVDRAVFHLR